MTDLAITYRCELDRLDQDEAQFAAGSTGVELVLPRQVWEDLGRPGNVYITPTASEPQR